MTRYLDDYVRVEQRIFDIEDDGCPVVRDEALLRARAPEYDRLLSEVPAHTEASFAGQEKIDRAVGDDADLNIHVGHPRSTPGETEVGSDRSSWHACPPHSAWKAPVRAAIKAGRKGDRTLSLDSLAAYASPDEQELLVQVEFQLPSGGYSRSVPLAETAHIAAMVNVGKSTLARALARQEADQGGRTLFLVASTVEGFQLARRLRKAGNLKPVVLIGQSDERRHLENREHADRSSDDFSVYLEDDWETIGRGCPLEALAETGHDRLPERSHYRPCDDLYFEMPSKTGKPRFRRTACGFAESCPSVEWYRRLRDADVIICTVPAFIDSKVPEWIDPRGLRVSEFAYESSDPIKQIELEGARLRRGFLERSLPYRRRHALEEFRTDEVAGQAAELNQAIGRGLRGNKSINVFFIDPGFVPLLAEIEAVLVGGTGDGVDRDAFEHTFAPTRTVIRTFLEDVTRQGVQAQRYGGRR